MYDEIKEILEYIKAYYLDCNIDKVFDYITNLQVEINKLTTESTEWESKYYDLLNILKGSDK